MFTKKRLCELRRHPELITRDEVLALLNAETVAWMTTREGDASFPRLHKEEAQADYWVDYCNVAPKIVKHKLISLE